MSPRESIRTAFEGPERQGAARGGVACVHAEDGHPKPSPPRTRTEDQQGGTSMAPTSKVKPIPETYRRVTPALTVKGGAQALAFYNDEANGGLLDPARPPPHSNQ